MVRLIHFSTHILDDLLDGSSSSSEGSVDTSRVPTCPNGLRAMQYSDGRAVMCLPGKNQCPENSVCYFNGMDFFCCPNADDPYDHHVFGGSCRIAHALIFVIGYDGEEVKHGYKYAPSKLNIRRLKDDPARRRLRRQSGTIPMAFDMENVNMPLRFDCNLFILSLFNVASSSNAHPLDFSGRNDHERPSEEPSHQPLHAGSVEGELPRTPPALLLRHQGRPMPPFLLERL